MSLTLRNIADIITSSAGWKKAEPEADGSFHFALEGGLGFSLSSPDGQTMFLSAVVGSYSDGDTAEAKDTILRMASLCVGAMKKRPSILSMRNGDLELYREFSAVRTDERDIQAIATGFLNDAAWWMKQGGTAAPSANPFGMYPHFSIFDGIN